MSSQRTSEGSNSAPDRNAGRFLAFDSLLTVMLETLNKTCSTGAGSAEVLGGPAGNVFADLWGIWSALQNTYGRYAGLQYVLSQPYELPEQTACEIRAACRQVVELNLEHARQFFAVTVDETFELEQFLATQAGLSRSLGLACALYRLARTKGNEAGVVSPQDPDYVRLLLDSDVGLTLALRTLGHCLRLKVREAYPESTDELNGAAKEICDQSWDIQTSLRNALRWALLNDEPLPGAGELDQRLAELAQDVIELALAEPSRSPMATAAGIACALRALAAEESWADRVKKAWDDLTVQLFELYKNISGALTPVIDQAASKVQPALDQASGAIGASIEEARTRLNPVIDKVAGAVSSILDQAKSRLAPAVNRTKDKATMLATGLLQKLWGDAVVEVTGIYYLRLADPDLDLTAAVPGLKVLVKQDDLYVRYLALTLPFSSIFLTFKGLLLLEIFSTI